MVAEWQRALRVAQTDEPADLLFANAQVVNVFTGEVEPGNVAVVDGRIVGVGDYATAHQIVDLGGAYLAPSFIDGHIHTESSLLWLPQFARAVVPHGTGAVITDPHEIVNVAGLEGFEAIVAASHSLPLGVHFTVPSCVPASPLETSGAVMSVDKIAAALGDRSTVGLGEMMNFPGVLAGSDDIFAKLQAASGRRRDGHAPGVVGRRLDAYCLSGMTSDHESTQLDEAREKLARGMMLMLREGSTEHNMLELLPLVTDATYARCCFVSDDRDCAMLMHDGHMNVTLRRAVESGLDPVRAIRMATFNTADYFRLDSVGAVAPGYWANLVVLDDLSTFSVRTVYYQGKRVAAHGKPEFEVSHDIPAALLNTFDMVPLTEDRLRLPAENARQAIGAIDGQIVTQLLEVKPTVRDGLAVSDTDKDLLKLVCVERHHRTGNVGVGLIHGFGLRRGALASSIAHDAHNVIAVGVDDADIIAAVEAVAAMQGGLAAVSDGKVIAQLPLPVAGILSDEPLEEVAHAYEHMEHTAHELGSQLASPFGLLAFMALSVIPEARVSDQGFLRLV